MIKLSKKQLKGLRVGQTVWIENNDRLSDCLQAEMRQQGLKFVKAKITELQISGDPTYAETEDEDLEIVAKILHPEIAREIRGYGGMVITPARVRIYTDTKNLER